MRTNAAAEIGMSKGTSWITDVFDDARSFDEMVAVDGDAPTCEADAGTEHREPDALTTIEGSRSPQTGVVVGVHWLIGFLKRLERRVAALEAERTPPHRPANASVAKVRHWK